MGQGPSQPRERSSSFATPIRDASTSASGPVVCLFLSLASVSLASRTILSALSRRVPGTIETKAYQFWLISIGRPSSRGVPSSGGPSANFDSLQPTRRLRSSSARS